MSKSNVIGLEDRERIIDPLTELLREGAQRLIPRWSLQNRPKGVTAKAANGDGPGR